MTETAPEAEPTAAHAPEQAEMPFAVVQGAPVHELPQDLYIPPDALEVFLEAFEGPLDLLLYLIKRQNLEILDIPIADITHQYMEYVDVITRALVESEDAADASEAAHASQQYRLELAGEYLVMAAMLAEIKSRMLLPKPVSDDDDGNDPRADLVRRLQEYERFKKAAEDLGELPRVERDVFLTEAPAPDTDVVKVPPKVELKELLKAMREVLERVDMFSHHQIQRETLSLRERMTEILATVNEQGFTEFRSLFTPAEGRMGVVVTFIASLELLKEGFIELVQNELYGPIHIKAAGSAMATTAESAQAS